MAQAVERKAPRVGELEDKASKKKNKKPDKEAELPKKPSKLRFAMLISLLWLAIISVGVLLILYDPTEDGVIRGSVLLFLNPEELSREEYYEGEIIANMDWERELGTLEEELELRSNNLDLREADLDDREDVITEREGEIEDLFNSLSEQQASGVVVTNDLANTVKILETMTASKAAAALSGMDYDNALNLCRMMKPKKLAAILNAMDEDTMLAFIDALGEPPETDIE